MYFNRTRILIEHLKSVENSTGCVTNTSFGGITPIPATRVLVNTMMLLACFSIFLSGARYI